MKNLNSLFSTFLALLFLPCSLSLCLQQCLSCSETGFCLQCSSQYVVASLTANKGCLPCRPGCLTCQSESGNCLNCASGYYRNVTTTLCERCNVDYCQACYEYMSDYCQVCRDGYYLVQATGRCESCSIYKNSLNCRESLILSCQPFYYVSFGHNCLPCMNHCIGCISSEYCNLCQDGYYGTICQSCHSSCQSCSKANICLKCKKGYFGSNGGVCQKCATACEECGDDGVCLGCNDGKYLQTGLCVQVPEDKKIVGCTTYSSTLTCSKCLPSFYLSNFQTCLRCSLLCETCNGMHSRSSCTCISNISSILSGSTSSACQPLFKTSTYKILYVNEWNYPSNFTYYGNNVNTVNKACENWKYGERVRVRFGMIGGYGGKIRIKVGVSLAQDIDEGRYLVGINGVVVKNVSSLLREGAVCSDGLNKSTQYTEILEIDIGNIITANLLSPLNPALPTRSNYLQLTSLSFNMFITVSELLVFYEPCHETCTLCQMDKCVLCEDRSMFIENQKCVKQCSQFMFLDDGFCRSRCEVGEYGNKGGWPWKCEKCVSGCANCKENGQCLACEVGFYLFNSVCSTSCPVATFPNKITLHCTQCSAPCFSCLSSTQCLSCSYNFLFNKSCISINDCPYGMYPSIQEMKCVDCEGPCRSCQGKGICLSCKAGFLFDKQCLSQCPATYFPNSTILQCSSCQLPCRTCSTSAKLCTSCLSLYLHNNTCFSTCPDNMYKNSTNMKCQSCIFPCQHCIDHANFCLKCVQGYLYHEALNKCYKEDECKNLQGSYLGDNTCLMCPIVCKSCLGEKNCVVCQKGYYLMNGICGADCPFSYYADANNGRCQPCSSSCSSCLYAPNFCISCPANSRLTHLNTCSLSCPLHTQLPPSCQPCTLPCQTCSQKSTKCTSCISQYYFYESTNQCLLQCFDTFYENEITMRCQSCDENCLRCEKMKDGCSSCKGSKYLEISDRGNGIGKCVDQCKSGYYGYNLGAIRMCMKCLQPCLTCINSSTLCLSCTSGFLHNGSCHLECPTSTYIMNSTSSSNNSSDDICINCPLDCFTCSSSISCYSCKQGSYLFAKNNSCIKNCPLGYLSIDQLNTCELCEFPCQQCIGIVSNCSKCFMSESQLNNSNVRKYSYYLHQGMCLRKCPAETYALSNVCLSCISPCLQCLSSSLCLSCVNNFYLVGKDCLESCPDTYYLNQLQKVCVKCVYPCKSCLSEGECSSCVEGVRIGGICSMTDECGNGYYLDMSQSNGVCLKCRSVCSECFQFSKCNKCSNSSFALLNGECLQFCPLGYYSSIVFNQIRCIQCAKQCNKCQSQTKCTSCVYPYSLYNSVCLQSCPAGYYWIEEVDTEDSESGGGLCEICGQLCKTCIYDKGNCLSCKNGYVLHQFRCISQCPLGTYLQLINMQNGNYSQCRQCRFPCKFCSSYNICSSCLHGYLETQMGDCVKDCKFPKVISYFSERVSCTSECPSQLPYVKMESTSWVCSSACQFPYIHILQNNTCMMICPDDQYYVNKMLRCQKKQETNDAVDLKVVLGSIKIYVDWMYRPIAVLQWSQDVQYGSNEDNFVVTINNEAIYAEVGRSLAESTESIVEYEIISKQPKYVIFFINPESLSSRSSNSYITLTFINNHNLLIKSSLTSLPLQQSAFTTLLPDYETYTEDFQVTTYFLVFGQVLVAFFLLIGLVLLIFNWYGKVFELLHFCQLMFLVSILEIQYPPNLWLFFKGFKNSHFYFIGNWFIDSKMLNSLCQSTQKITSVFVDSNFIRIFGHIFCLFAILIVICGVLALGKFIKKSGKQKIDLVGNYMWNKFKIVKWSHIHDFVMSIAMILVFSFFVQTYDYQTKSQLQSLAITFSYMCIILLIIYYVFMGRKLYRIVQMSINDPSTFSTKNYLFRANMLSITQSAVHPHELYLNYLRAIRIVFFGGILGAFNTSPMLCVASFLIVLLISALIYLLVKPYPDQLQNILLGFADIATFCGIIFVALINFQIFEDPSDQKYEQYLKTKWRLGWVAMICFIIAAFLLLTQLLVSIVKGNFTPLNLSAEDSKNITKGLFRAPKVIEVYAKKEIEGWENNKRTGTEYGIKYQPTQISDEDKMK